MPITKTTLTAEEIANFDIDELLRDIEEREAKRQLRKERPWTYDIIRVLWGSRSWVSMDQLCDALWGIRNPSGLPMPKAFRKTVQSTLNQHTSQSSEWNGKLADDLFYSPKGKRSGTWALHNRERAVAWLNERKLRPI